MRRASSVSDKKNDMELEITTTTAAGNAANNDDISNKKLFLWFSLSTIQSMEKLNLAIVPLR